MLALGAGSLLADEGNLLQNPSFADDGLGGALNWRTESRMEVVRGAGPDGADVMRFPLKGKTASVYQGGIALAVGEPHRFGCWVRTKGVGGCGARIVFFNSAWRLDENLYLPDDTKGEWKKLEWSGKIMPNGPYSFGLYIAKPAADGCVELASPYLLAESDAARTAAKRAPAARPFRARIVPINPKLTRMDAAAAKMEFFFPGVLEKPADAYELRAKIDGEGAVVTQGADGEGTVVTLGADMRATVDFGKVPAGRHRMSVALVDRATGKTVAADTYPVRTVDRTNLPEGRRLNNFVRELLSVPLKDGAVDFVNPREGWVYVGFENAPVSAQGFLDGGDSPVVKDRPGEPTDTMRWLSPGRHTLTVKDAGDGGRLLVRTVKPLMISPTCERPPFTEFATHDIGSDWWRRYLYHTFNSYRFFGWTDRPNIRYPGSYEMHRDVAEYGFEVGGEARIPETSGKWETPEILEKTLTDYETWKSGFGLLVDESSPYAPRQNMFSMAETCWKRLEDPRPISIFWNSCLYALCQDPRGQASMLAALANSGNGCGMIVPEVYLISYPTEKEKRWQEQHYADLLASVRDQVPAAAEAMMFCFGGYNTSGGWNGYSAPDTDMKVVIDDFIRKLAVDPAFADLGGLAFYAMGCYQELFRWYMDAIRHYAVLGNTESLSERHGFVFKPGHITDNDFGRGFEGWKVEPAETNSIVPYVRKDYGRFVQARKMVPSGFGDTALLLTRSEKGPNKVSQTMRGLKPGRRYYVSCCTMDLDDLEKPGPGGEDVTFGVRIGAGGVEDPLLRITHKNPHDRRANGNSRWGNRPVAICATHSTVFRAEREEVELTLSDWASDTYREGRVGQRRILNYVIVRPYYEETPLPAKGEAPRFNHPRVFGVRPGSPDIFRLPVSGTRPMTFAAEGLPDGVTLDAATGVLSGATRQAGTNAVRFTVSNAFGTCRQDFRLVVGPEFQLTPPMGFNTFGGLGCGDRLTDASVRAGVRALLAKLADHGYSYCNVDDGWQGERGGPLNALQPNGKFGDMKALGDYIHSFGLKFGLYSTPYVTSYAGFPGSSSLYPDRNTEFGKVPKDVGPYLFDEQDAKQAVAWGCDYYKYDWKMRIPEWGTNVVKKYRSVDLAERMGGFFRAADRDVCFENSHHVDFGLMERLTAAGSLTRVDGDLMDVWSKAQLPNRPWLGVRDLWLVQRDAKWRTMNRPGHWNMPCPLRLGLMGGWEAADYPLHPTRLTREEQIAHFSLWCLWASPIIVGAPIDKLDDFTLRILTNDEMIAINQDPLGLQAEERRVDWGEVLVKRLENGDVAVGLFNPSDEVHDKQVKFDFKLAGFDGPVKVRDLWRHCDLGVHEGEIMCSVPRHGCHVFRLSPVKARGKLIFHFDFNSLRRTKEAVIETLEHVAAAGYNAVLWEIENTVRFDGCPEIAAPDAFTKTEFAEILAAAKRLGLEPIPLMQTFGHGEYVLRHAKYHALREVPGRYDCYCPSKPETRAFLKRLLHEYLEIFGPDVKRFHLGGDEAWFYRSCPTCKARDSMDLYVEHLEEVAAELREKGIRPGCWHDMVLKFSRESGAKLERFRDYTVWFWDYAYPKSWHPWGQADAPLRQMRDAGCETIICGSSQSWKDDPFLVRYGEHRFNLTACADLARRERLSGLCVTSWTIHQGLKRLQYPLFDYAARRYLAPGESSETDWAEAVSTNFGTVPTDALDAISAWQVRYGLADGRGWNGYKDGTVPPPTALPIRFKDGQVSREKLADELAVFTEGLRAPQERLARLPDETLTPLGRLLVDAARLKVKFHEVGLRALRGEKGEDVPWRETTAFYTNEYTSVSADLATKIIYPYAK